MDWLTSFQHEVGAVSGSLFNSAADDDNMHAGSPSNGDQFYTTGCPTSSCNTCNCTDSCNCSDWCGTETLTCYTIGC